MEKGKKRGGKGSEKRREGEKGEGNEEEKVKKRGGEG